MVNEQFQWKRHPEAEKLLIELLDTACAGNGMLAVLSKNLLAHTSTRLFDWVDHLIVDESLALTQQLLDLGFTIEGSYTAGTSYRHLGAQFPAVVMRTKPVKKISVAVKVDSIADFLMMHGITRPIEGSFFSPYRRSLVDNQGESELWIVERRASRSMDPIVQDPAYVDLYFKWMERWQSRERHGVREDQEMKLVLQLSLEMAREIGPDVAASIVLEVERKYWQARNRAAQIQKGRQDRFGMGWANHDHHTFRSSRRYFHDLVVLFEHLGFYCRERFYAGEEAGWGAQVMENPTCGFVLFLDVDLAPNEVAIDFAHQTLPERNTLGTVGLWCALHGDSILQAGMHHLELQFMFNELKSDLEHHGVSMMQPFSDFDYLRQAFTKGETWSVDPTRVEKLLQKGMIERSVAERFITQGAVGSHMENLQRRDGYKGFNQKNVSFIIKETDPRTLKSLDQVDARY